MSMARQGMHNVYKDGDYKAPEEEPRYKNMQDFINQTKSYSLSTHIDLWQNCEENLKSKLKPVKGIKNLSSNPIVKLYQQEVGRFLEEIAVAKHC